MVSIKSDILEIKFSGGEISPEKISLSELASNVLLFEKLIKPIVEAENPTISFDKSYVGLQELGNRSISLRYIIKQHKELFIAAFVLLIESISTNNIERLPAKTIDEIEAVSRFNSKYSCKAEFGETVGNEFKTYAHFTDEFVAEKIAKLKGNTTVYGKIKWVGGDKPTITLILLNGDQIDVLVTEEDAQNWKPYSHVGIAGDAVWRGKDLKLSKLTAKEIFHFDKKTPKEGFSYLKQLFQDHRLSTDNT